MVSFKKNKRCCLICILMCVVDDLTMRCSRQIASAVGSSFIDVANFSAAQVTDFPQISQQSDGRIRLFGSTARRFLSATKQLPLADRPSYDASKSLFFALSVCSHNQKCGLTITSRGRMNIRRILITRFHCTLSEEQVVVGFLRLHTRIAVSKIRR